MLGTVVIITLLTVSNSQKPHQEVQLTPLEIQRNIQQAIAMGPGSMYIVPPGEYIFGELDLLVLNPNKFTLAANGVHFIFSPGYGINVLNATNTAIFGFTVDYSPSCFAQGVITAVDPKKNTITMKLEDGFSPPEESKYFSFNNEVKTIYWDPKTETKIRPQPMFTPCKNATKISPSVYELSVNLSPHIPLVGQGITLSNRFSSNISGAVPTYYRGIYNVFNSANVATSNMTIYGGADMGVLEWGGYGNHVYTNITITRHPNPSYPFRLLSTNLDGFHSFSVEHGPLVQSSFIGYMGDDFANVHNRMMVLFPASKTESLVQTMTMYIMDPSDVLYCEQLKCNVTRSGPLIQPGDVLGVFNLNLSYIQNVTVTENVACTDDDILTAAKNVRHVLETEYKIPMTGIMPNDITVRKITVSMTSSPSLPPYAYIQFYRQSAENAVFKNNVFVDSYDNCFRAQGNYLHLENNIFNGASAGLSIEIDKAFLEGSLGLHSLLIKNNTFVDVSGCTSAKDCFTIGPSVTDVVAEENVFKP
eukprot:m.39544 g.39544  ORF g.39544 m.39544 type:complete len:532 (+) comp9565_c0_seq2:194-1789(+)